MDIRGYNEIRLKGTQKLKMEIKRIHLTRWRLRIDAAEKPPRPRPQWGSANRWSTPSARQVSTNRTLPPQFEAAALLYNNIIKK